MEFEKTYWQLGDLLVSEPITAITDLLVTAVCFYAFIKLKPKSKFGWTHVFYRYYFLFLGLSTLYGAIIGHAFNLYFGFEWKLPGWLFSMFAIALIERGSIMHAKPYMNIRTGNIFSYLNVIEFFILLFCVSYFRNFALVEAHAAYGLLIVVLSFEMVVYIKSKQVSSIYIIIAIGIGVLAAIVHIGGIFINKWFNHLDLSHIFMALSGYYFYLGASKIPNKIE
jgi:hypothetical protein